MFAKIRHLAIVSSQYALLAKFYESLFGMRTSDSGPKDRALTVGDGYVGLNINPRKAGRQAGLDHFGFEVEDVSLVLARIQEKYPSIRVLRRPGNRPFAGISTHDPSGNVFDLSQAGMENRKGIYTEGEWAQDRYINHFAVRTVTPEIVANFYVDLFQLRALEKPAGDPNFYLTDGRVTLIVMPWKITDYEGSGIERPSLDHIGFKVESVEAVKKKIQALPGINPLLAPMPVGVGQEGEARLKLFLTCPYGKYHLADPDGVLIDVGEG